MANKALKLMEKAPSTKERAGNFVNTISRNLQKSFLDTLVDQKEKLEDKILSLLDFSLEIDINRGQSPVTREEAEKRFEEVVNLKYDLLLLDQELQVKQGIYDDLFKEEEVL